jgi:hypothetical protein
VLVVGVLVVGVLVVGVLVVGVLVVGVLVVGVLVVGVLVVGVLVVGVPVSRAWWRPARKREGERGRAWWRKREGERGRWVMTFSPVDCGPGQRLAGPASAFRETGLAWR